MATRTDRFYRRVAMMGALDQSREMLVEQIGRLPEGEVDYLLAKMLTE